MIDRRFFAAGVSLALMVGCSSQPKSAQNKNADSLAMEPRSIPGSSVRSDGSPAPDVVAGKADDYVNSLAQADPANLGDTGSRSFYSDPVDKRQHSRKPAIPQPSDEQINPGNALGSAVANNDSVIRHNEPRAQVASAPQFPPSLTPRRNEPIEKPESEDFVAPKAAGDALLQRLVKRVRENPRDISSQLDLQLYRMINDEQAPDLATMVAMSHDNRELVEAIIDTLNNFRSTVREDANMLPEDQVKPLLDLSRRVAPMLELSVPAVALCDKVERYGKYDPISPAVFPAMKERKVIVYCEVANFVPRQNKANLWETNLTEQIMLFTDTGHIAWSDDRQEVSDECRNPRHDFYVYKVITLPPTLSVGTYKLKVSISDKNTDHWAEASVPLTVMAQ